MPPDSEIIYCQYNVINDADPATSICRGSFDLKIVRALEMYELLQETST